MGIKMNIAQTKVMVVDNTPINVNNVLIENVQGYVYLGQGRAYRPPQRRPMDLTCHHLETILQERTTRETSQAVERRPGQILERHDMAEDSTRQGDLETAC